MNKRFLNHAYFTDIITFDYTDGNRVSGDLYISVERVKDNAAAFGSSVAAEMHRVLVHGVLHLLGYMDKNAVQKKAIRAKEDFYLVVLNLDLKQV